MKNIKKENQLDGAFVGVKASKCLQVVRDGKVLVPKLVCADHMFARMRGLLFRPQLGLNEGLWIIPCNSIHMFFMRHTIDVVFLNKDKKVVKIYSSVKPWRIARGGRSSYSVLELADGAAKKANIQVEDQLEIIKCKKA